MSGINSQRYIGEELDLFADALIWKKYIAAKIIPYLGSEVMEVGAGIGTNTIILCTKKQKRWLCIEPDSQLIDRLSDKIHQCEAFSAVETRLGTIVNVLDNEYFDSILYVDVLEHIKDDVTELACAGRCLRKGGRLIVLAPAHQWLYSPFDIAVGHFRRYTKKSLAAIAPPGLKLEQLYYIDSAGLLASAGNLLILKKSIPSLNQIRFWNNWLIPLSMKLDSLINYRVGKTVIGVWVKTTDT